MPTQRLLRNEPTAEQEQSELSDQIADAWMAMLIDIYQWLKKWGWGEITRWRHGTSRKIPAGW